ncbi:MAG: helix-turn-helix domain-containing protein [Firmicutes bacterium]|nr:helix-turn-helix domain-containing protein [Bacillota bacterium]
MFHRAEKLEFKDGTVIELSFEDGKVKEFDMASLTGKYPQLKALEDRELFESGRLEGPYGVVWNDELDVEAETVYAEGTTVRIEKRAERKMTGRAVVLARARRSMTQSELAAAAGINQSDLSRIEKGLGNPSIATLARIAKALGGTLNISIDF